MDPVFSYGDKPLTSAAPSVSGGQSFSYGDAPITTQKPIFNFGDKPVAPVTAQPQVSSGLAFANSVQDTIKSFNRPLIGEDFIKDDRLANAIYEDLKLRANNGGFVNAATDVAITAGGGVAVNAIDKLDREGRFELWQNVQRSFAGGHTITTLSEAKLAATGDEDTKIRMGAGYQLFDSMDNAFTGNGTWGESFDALWDYGSAMILDPTTVVGIGVGRLYTRGGAKVAAQGIKLATREAFKIAMQKELAKGATVQVAKVAAKATAQAVAKQGFMKIGMKKAAVLATPDIISNVGLDVLYQKTRIETGAQQDYSFSETALAAAGAVALPMVAGLAKVGAAGIEKLAKGTSLEGTFSTYKTLKSDLAGKSAVYQTNRIKQRVDLNKVDAELRKTFDDFNTNMLNYVPWDDAKIQAGKLLDSNNLPVTAGEMENLFWHTLLVGDKKGTKKGYVEALHDAGFVMVERDPTDTATNWVGDVISWMEPSLVTKVITDFETATGAKLNLGSTATELSANFKARGRGAGQILADSSYASRILGEKSVSTPGMARMLKGLGKAAVDKHPPERLGYLQSVWKRLMTSATATTALNIKGWKSSVVFNSYSDLINGALYGVRAVGYSAIGNNLAAKEMMQKGRGTILGLAKRGHALLNFNDTLDAAENFYTFFPEIHKELYKNVGDADAVGSLLKRYNLNEANKGLRAVEGSVETLQKITGTILQDEVTKNFSFITNLDQSIMREYGLSYNDFIKQHGKDAFLEMRSERFVTKTIAPALDRTLRETASKSWSDKVGTAPMLKFAKAVENVSSHSYGGFVIPFGRFFNTSTAFLGDAMGINAVRYAMKKFGGYEVDIAQESGQELLAKGIAGWTVFAYAASKGLEKIENGLAWNQGRDEQTGETKDFTYDAPDTWFHLGGQIIAHLLKDGDVPNNLREEGISVLAGQTFRSGQEGVKVINDLLHSALGGDMQELGTSLLGSMLAASTNYISGTTRALDPINQAAMVYSGDYTTPDRRQGYRFLNESLRYVDKLPGLLGIKENRQPRYSPSQGEVMADVGKSFGARTTPENSPINMMLNSIGSRDWQMIKWGGDPEVKNRLDQLIYPQLNTIAATVLEKYPDFFEKPLAWRQVRVDEIIQAAKANAQGVLEAGVGKDKGLSLLKELSALPKGNVKKALEYLGITEDPVDIAALDGGPEKLKTLIYLAKDWDKIMYDAK